MFSVDELFYGENEPTWIVRHFEEEVPPYTRYMVPSIELRVPMCCIKCEIKVKKQLLRIRGDRVDEVVCDLWNQKVIVTGNVDPAKVLKETRRVKSFGTENKSASFKLVTLYGIRTFVAAGK